MNKIITTVGAALAALSLAACAAGAEEAAPVPSATTSAPSSGVLSDGWQDRVDEVEDTPKALKGEAITEAFIADTQKVGLKRAAAIEDVCFTWTYADPMDDYEAGQSRIMARLKADNIEYDQSVIIDSDDLYDALTALCGPEGDPA